jgi:hypothetical protein
VAFGTESQRKVARPSPGAAMKLVGLVWLHASGSMSMMTMPAMNCAFLFFRFMEFSYVFCLLFLALFMRVFISQCANRPENRSLIIEFISPTGAFWVR